MGFEVQSQNKSPTVVGWLDLVENQLGMGLREPDCKIKGLQKRGSDFKLEWSTARLFWVNCSQLFKRNLYQKGIFVALWTALADKNILKMFLYKLHFLYVFKKIT